MLLSTYEELTTKVSKNEQNDVFWDRPKIALKIHFP